MSKNPNQPQLAKEELLFLERSLAGLPTSKSSGAGTGDADGLLKFSYHQNPYLRTYAKVLWSGYAIARGQLIDGHQRFSQARRDATVSAVDALTTKALDDAHTALENAMAPDGTIAGFLQVLREKTLQRLWSRVCETTGLPPPRFHVLFGKVPAVTREELEAEEMAELNALRKQPDPPPPSAADDDDDEGDGDDECDDDEDDGPSEGEPAKLSVALNRRGGAETAAELILALAADALRELRTKKATGALTITLTVQGETIAGPSGGGDRKRSRRRRKRNNG
ncbi:MAG: hypothetical protein HY902_00595 [Deltaproteobacteria bacterium]|nr:hypothetical protein [Deltaproteobacteria bacterium]